MAPYVTHNDLRALERRLERLLAIIGEEENSTDEDRLSRRLRRAQENIRDLQSRHDAIKREIMVTKEQVQAEINRLREQVTRDTNINTSAVTAMRESQAIISRQIEELVAAGAGNITEEMLNDLKVANDTLTANQDGLAAAIPAGTPAPANQTGGQQPTHPTPEQPQPEPNPSGDTGTQQQNPAGDTGQTNT